MSFEHWLTTPKEWYRLRPIAQARRRYPTPQVAALWERLRRRQIHRLEFRRQEAIGGYLVDFFTYGALLAIVVDTPDLSGHLQPGASRTRALDERGVLELRFSSDEIDRDIDAVVDRIATTALERRRNIRITRTVLQSASAPITDNASAHHQRDARYETGHDTLARIQNANSIGRGTGAPNPGPASVGDSRHGSRNDSRNDSVGDDAGVSGRAVGEPCENYRRWPSSRRQWRRLRESVRKQRKEGTVAEKTLWNCLRNRKLDGLAFRRQKALGDFIADFYCSEARLVIEIDGPVHDDTAARDDARTARIEALGLRVIRFSNDDISTRLDKVLATIQAEALTVR